MKNFSIDARQIKAAMVMQAKADIRYYLNGLLIGGGKVVATDGHRMIIVNSPKSTFEPLIFSIKGALSKKAITCEFIFLDGKNGVIISKDSMGRDIDAVVKFSIVDGKFPDYKKVVPKSGGHPTKEAGFNIGYLSDVNKSALALGSKLTHGVLSFYDT